MDYENQIAILRAMLNHIRIENPQFKALISRETGGKGKNNKEKENAKEITRRLKIQNKKLLEQVTILKERLKQLKAARKEMMPQLLELMKLNNSLAKALGSCQECWGDNQACSYCSGEGSPGWRPVNRRLFNLYVLPALEKLDSLGEKK